MTSNRYPEVLVMSNAHVMISRQHTVKPDTARLIQWSSSPFPSLSWSDEMCNR